MDDTNVVIVFNPITPLYEAFDGITYQYDKHFYQISISILLEGDENRLWTIFACEVDLRFRFVLWTLNSIPLKLEKVNQYLIIYLQ